MVEFDKLENFLYLCLSDGESKCCVRFNDDEIKLNSIEEVDEILKQHPEITRLIIDLKGTDVLIESRCCELIKKLKFGKQIKELRLKIIATKIMNLEFLKNFPNIESLFLDGCAIIDYSAIGSLNNLKSIEISQCYRYFKNINFASQLKNLKSIKLYRNNLCDISGIYGLENLEYLDISSNRSTNFDYEVLKSLPSLIFLGLSHGFDLQKIPLEVLKNLKYLSLCSCRISDISILENAKNLECLYLSQNNIEDLSSLENMPLLKSLDLVMNEVKDIAKLEGLTNLQELKIAGCPVSISSEELFDRIPSLKILNNKSRDGIGFDYTPYGLDAISKQFVKTYRHFR